MDAVGILNTAKPMRTVRTGIALLSMPVRDELIHCCAIGNMVSGNAIHVIPRSRTFFLSLGAIGVLLVGISQRTMHPNVMRKKVTRPGSNASKPISMKKNEAPQIPAAPRRRPQSRSSNFECSASTVSATP